MPFEILRPEKSWTSSEISWSSVTEAEVRQGILAWHMGYKKMKTCGAKTHSRDASAWANREEPVKEPPKLRRKGQEGASQTMAWKRIPG